MLARALDGALKPLWRLSWPGPHRASQVSAEEAGPGPYGWFGCASSSGTNVLRVWWHLALHREARTGQQRQGGCNKTISSTVQRLPRDRPVLARALDGALKPLWRLSLPGPHRAAQASAEEVKPGPHGGFGCVCLIRLRRGLCACPVALGLADLNRTKGKQPLPRQSALHMHIECAVRAGDACFMKLQ